MQQLSIDDVLAAKREGMERSERNANQEWKARALTVIKFLCQRQETFCADDVAELLQFCDEQTHDKRAIGSIFRQAAKRGLCVQTDQFLSSRNPKNHGCPRRIWKSLLYRP